MRVCLVLAIALAFSGPAAFAKKKKAPPPPPSSLRHARQEYKQGQFNLALQHYHEAQDELQKRQESEDSDDPVLREAVDAEVVALLYATKDFGPLLESSILFLQKYPNSPYGFQVSYILASTLHDQRRFDEALRVFSRYSLDSLRSVDADTRTRLLILLESLFGAIQQPGAQRAIFLERQQLWRRRNGSYALNSQLQALTKTFPTMETLTAFVQTVEPEQTRRALLAQLDPEALLPNVQRRRGRFLAAVGVGLAGDAFRRASYPTAQLALRPDLEFTLRTSALGNLWRLRGVYDVFSYGSGGLKAQSLGVSFQYLRQVAGSVNGWAWGLGIGPTYRTTWVAPADAGFKNAVFVELLTQARVAYGDQAFGLFKLRYGPGFVGGLGFSFQNYSWAVEWESIWPTPSGASDWSFFVELAGVELAPPLGWTRFTLGARIRLGAYSEVPPLP